MSAFLCGDDHISALACYAVDNGLWQAHRDRDDDERAKLGLILYTENAKSVACRYNEDPEESFEYHAGMHFRLIGSSEISSCT